MNREVEIRLGFFFGVLGPMAVWASLTSRRRPGWRLRRGVESTMVRPDTEPCRSEPRLAINHCHREPRLAPTTAPP